MNANPYDILGVKPQASQDEIKNAYRNLAKKLHPDLNPGNKTAETKFKEINAAYELIGTPEMKAKYDRGEINDQQDSPKHGRPEDQPFYYETQSGPAGARGRYSQAFHGMDDDLFSSIFGNRGESRQQNTDELYKMSVSFNDSILGSEKEITLPNGKRLRVKIPAGIETGKKLRFAGQANQTDSTNSAAPGNIYVEIEVAPSPLFTRQGNDIEIEIPISVPEALLGGEIKVPTVDGSILLNIPPLVSSGQKLRVGGKGVKGKGDQLVKLKIVNPNQKTDVLDEEFKNAVELWKKRHPFDPRAGKQ